jgi:hypothetical protein
MFDHLERDRYDMQEYTAAPCLQDAVHALVSRERPKHRGPPHNSTTRRLMRIWPDKKQEIFVRNMCACEQFSSITNTLE